MKEGIVKRSELFIVSKLWCTHHEPKHAEWAVNRTLSDLGLDYLDLYYIHFPYSMGHVDEAKRYPNDWVDEFAPGNVPLESTWHALEGFVKQGLVKSIGISNYNGATLTDLLNYAKIKPAALQIEHHPYLTQEVLVKYAQDAGIQVVAYSSFGPMSFIELDLPRAKDTKPLFEQEAVASAAKKHGKTPAQVLLRWSTQRGVAVIPKSSNVSRLAQNLAVTDFDLNSEELKAISGLNKGLRFNDPLDDGFPIPVFV